MQKIPEYELMTEVMLKTFNRWGKRDKLYSKHFKNLPDVAFDIITTAFGEINVYHPYHFDVWWLRNHMRFRGSYRQEDMKILYQMIYTFLGLFARGGLNEIEQRKTKARPAKSG